MNNVKWQLRRCLVCHPRHLLKSRPPLIPIVAQLHTHGSLHTFSLSSLLPFLSPLVPALTLPSDKIKGPSEAAWDSGFILFVLCAQWGPVREKKCFFSFARPVQEAPRRISGSLRGIWQKSHRLCICFLGIVQLDCAHLFPLEKQWRKTATGNKPLLYVYSSTRSTSSTLIHFIIYLWAVYSAYSTIKITYQVKHYTLDL